MLHAPITGCCHKDIYVIVNITIYEIPMKKTPLGLMPNGVLFHWYFINRYIYHYINTYNYEYLCKSNIDV